MCEAFIIEVYLPSHAHACGSTEESCGTFLLNQHKTFSVDVIRFLTVLTGEKKNTFIQCFTKLTD